MLPFFIFPQILATFFEKTLQKFKIFALKKSYTNKKSDFIFIFGLKINIYEKILFRSVWTFLYWKKLHWVHPKFSFRNFQNHQTESIVVPIESPSKVIPYLFF